ncbi:MAG: hypothetical protein IKD70_04225 [Eggerthellaceae bacterium]|nr:hypothetical protein [Eggerthellaceae bacterium]
MEMHVRLPLLRTVRYHYPISSRTIPEVNMNQAFTCPHCGGPIAFDPAKDSMLCPYCDSEITVIDYRNALKAGSGAS